MTDRRRDPEYKNVTGYIPVKMLNNFKQEVQERKLTLNEAIEEAIAMWMSATPQEPETIHELVAQNIKVLEESGLPLKNLKLIARGEVLPTRTDFCAIITALKVPNNKKKSLWEKAFGAKDCDEERTYRSNK